MNKIGFKTDNLQPKHNYVPWVVVDGVHDPNVENEIRQDLFQYVCRKYKGPNRSIKCGMSFKEQAPVEFSNTIKNELKIDVFLQ